MVLTSMVLSTVGVLPMVVSANGNHGHGQSHFGGDHDDHGNHNNHGHNHGDDNDHGEDGDDNDDDNNGGDGDNTPPIVPPTCTENQHLDTNTNTCVNNPPTPPTPPTCTETQHLDTNTNTCVNNPVTPPTPTPSPTPTPTPSPTPSPTPTPNPTPTSQHNNEGGGNGPIAGSYGIVNGQGHSSNGGGQVLGESCAPFLTSYLGYGKKNNPEEVKKLQTFLNQYLHLNIPVNGLFGRETLEAVNQFQIKESNEVLMPWFKKGLLKSDKEATGYVYKTTLRRINLIKCSALNIPQPQLP